MHTPLLALLPLVVLPLLSPTPVLQDPSADSWTENADNEFVTRDQAQVYYFTPQHAYADELQEVAYTLYGSDIATLDRAGNIIDFTSNMLVIGDSRILIFDSPENAELILKLFVDLVKPIEFVERKPAPSEELRTAHYTPRYLSALDVLEALGPLTHLVEGRGDSSMPTPAKNVRVLNNSGLILMLDTQAHIDEMLAFLDSIDRPAAQLELTCYVLRGTDQPVSNNLPKELTSNLARLVPFAGFELASMGIVRTSAGSAGNLVSIEMQGKNEQFTLDTRISAFDMQKSGAEVLTMNGCQVIHSYTDVIDPSDVNARAAGKMRSRQLFSTSASINGGEYAVMGATGTDPIFVVLRFNIAK